MLKGIGVSSGYGIGRAVIINDVTIDYKNVKYTTAQEETARLDSAVDKFITKTKSIANSLVESAGEEESEILLGHIEMINDPFMLSQMKEQIEGGAVAEAAVDAVCNMFIEMFSSLEDELTRQRASDIKDIRDDLLRILLNISTVDIGAVESGSVLIAKDFTPSMTGRIDTKNVAAVIAEVGGVTSHSAILARAMGIPAVLSLQNALSSVKDGEELIVNGFSGEVILSPSEDEKKKYLELDKEYQKEKAQLIKFANMSTVTKNGIEKQVYGNIGKPEDAQLVVQNGGEGVGLFRTEFLFMDRNEEPTEDEQFEAYSTVAKALSGKEVIIRTLDIGGDKKIDYLGLDKEDNPFLGHRAIRYCLDNEELFCRQLRAILRASQYGNLKIMLPLITTAEEVISAKKLIEKCKKELIDKGENIGDVPVGIMVETPSAALISDELAKLSDFFSIGTNDLTGYVMAVDRGNSKVSNLYDIFQPSVLKAIEMTVKNAKAAGIPVGMCGEGAADERLIPKLLEWGLDEFSVSPSSILKTRQVISCNNA